MLASEPGKRFLYLWTKRIVIEDSTIVTRVCFGITSNVKKRESEYGGANGHIVKFCDVWEGISCPIETLEEQIKTVFGDHLVVGSKNARYEWLMEDITLEQIKGWINFEIQEHHPSIQYVTELL